MSDRSFLVAGLGNIGPEYELTRHNAGFMVLDAWAQASNAVFSTARYGDIASVSVKGRRFTLLKPSTYMNLSGNAVRYWLAELGLGPENLMVVCDDLNLPFGTARMRGKGSDGGHNGLKNIQEMIGTSDYARTRIGVGHEFSQGGQIDFVLGKFSQEQLEGMEEICAKAVKSIQTWALAGLQKAMTELNTKPETQKSAGEQ